MKQLKGLTAPQEPAQATPPLVQGSILIPLLTAYAHTGHSIDDLLEPLGLSLSGLNKPDCFVTHDTVYEVFERVAQKTSPDFPALVGQSIDWPRFAPFGKALMSSGTLAEFITRYCIAVGRASNAISMSLEITGKSSVLSAKRKFTPSRSPAYMDAYQVSRWITFLHEVAREKWAPHQVLVRLNRPECLPAYFFGIKPVGAGAVGYSIRFPSAWLLCAVSASSNTIISDAGNDADRQAPTDFLDSVKSVATSIIDRPNLSVSSLAAACGFREVALNGRLANHGVSLSGILAEAKCNRAKQLLAIPSLSIGEVAARLGYSDATACTRAFKRWTGQTPTEFRANLTEKARISQPSDGRRHRQVVALG